MNGAKIPDPEEEKLRLRGRIAQLIDMVGGPTRAASLLNRSRTTIDNWRSGESRVPLEDAYFLAKEAGVSLDWIATGDNNQLDMLAAKNVGSEFVRIAVYGAGSNDTLTELGFQPPAAFLRGWLDEAGIAPENCAVIMVQDDGMAPEIGPGDMVLVDRARATVESSGVYALLRQSAVLVRRVQIMVDGGVLIIPANSLYKRETLSTEAVEGLAMAGRVRAVLKMM